MGVSAAAITRGAQVRARLGAAKPDSGAASTRRRA